MRKWVIEGLSNSSSDTAGQRQGQVQRAGVLMLSSMFSLIFLSATSFRTGDENKLSSDNVERIAIKISFLSLGYMLIPSGIF